MLTVCKASLMPLPVAKHRITVCGRRLKLKPYKELGAIVNIMPVINLMPYAFYKGMAIAYMHLTLASNI